LQLTFSIISIRAGLAAPITSMSLHFHFVIFFDTLQKPMRWVLQIRVENGMGI
jgi:hypothetical protein